ncbi:MAG: hypothetical protein HQK88_10410 [Nitrospirae bacterium]|nr:hypothetical protein [Nitrospirota bacterium]MBF0534938.1 hypothetical protein [Nitrospirota bacterium]MBF0617211.1 hypothetical protein [Nitrospirota bacterium]
MLFKKFLMAVPLIVVFFASGCFNKTTVRQETSEQGTSATEAPAEPSHLSLMGTNFEDVEVPTELEIVQDESIIINTTNFSGGTLVYRGNVTTESIIKFFRISMPKNGWDFVVSSFAKKSTVLTFIKPYKNCMIFIQAPGDWQRNTRVQIWVSNSAQKGAQPLDQDLKGNQNLKNKRPDVEPAIRVN